MSDFILQIDRGFRPPLTFQTFEDIEAFLIRERDSWSWLDKSTSSSNNGNVNSLLNQYKDRWAERLINMLPQFRSGDAVVRDEFNQILRSKFTHDKLLTALDPEAASVNELSATDKQAAAIALAAVMGKAPLQDQGFLADWTNRIGTAYGLTILAGLNPSLTHGIKSSLESLKTDFQKSVSDVRFFLEQIRSEAGKQTQTIDEAAKAQLVELAQQHDEKSDEQQRQFSDLKNELEGTTRAYEVRMELEGPVRYWRTKSSLHRRRANIALTSLLAYSVASSVGLYCLFNEAAAHLPEKSEQLPIAALFKAAAFSIFFATIVLWIGRIILRIFLSERHLSTDADERRTMIMTFLALIKKRGVEEKDRQLVLAAIFRPGSDGIVGEEGPPDSLLAALANNLVKK